MSESAVPSKGELQEVRKALEYHVVQIIMAEDRKHGTRTTSGAVRAITELLWQFIQQSLAPDLYSFSTHAGRKSSISAEDVALVLRKLPEKLEQFHESLQSNGGRKGAALENFGSKKRHVPPQKKSRPKVNQHKDHSLSIPSSSSDESDLDDSAISGHPKSISPIARRKSLPVIHTIKQQTSNVLHLSSSSDEELDMKPAAKTKYQSRFPAGGIPSPRDSPDRSSSPPKRAKHNDKERQKNFRLRGVEEKVSESHKKTSPSSLGNRLVDESAHRSPVVGKSTTSTSAMVSRGVAVAATRTGSVLEDSSSDCESTQDLSSFQPATNHRRNSCKTNSKSQPKSQVADFMENLSSDSGPEFDEDNDPVPKRQMSRSYVFHDSEDDDSDQ